MSKHSDSTLRDYLRGELKLQKLMEIDAALDSSMAERLVELSRKMGIKPSLPATTAQSTTATAMEILGDRQNYRVCTISLKTSQQDLPVAPAELRWLENGNERTETIELLRESHGFNFPSGTPDGLSVVVIHAYRFEFPGVAEDAHEVRVSRSVFRHQTLENIDADEESYSLACSGHDEEKIPPQQWTTYDKLDVVYFTKKNRLEVSDLSPREQEDDALALVEIIPINEEDFSPVRTIVQLTRDGTYLQGHLDPAFDLIARDFSSARFRVRRASPGDLHLLDVADRDIARSYFNQCSTSASPIQPLILQDQGNANVWVVALGKREQWGVTNPELHAQLESLHNGDKGAWAAFTEDVSPSIRRRARNKHGKSNEEDILNETIIEAITRITGCDYDQHSWIHGTPYLNGSKRFRKEVIFHFPENAKLEKVGLQTVSPAYDEPPHPLMVQEEKEIQARQKKIQARQHEEHRNRLTKRQRQVLRLTEDGLSTAEIADRLSTGVRNVQKLLKAADPNA